MFNKQQLRTIIKSSIKKLYKEDHHLLKNDANERSLVHRFAFHFNKYIEEKHLTSDYHIDVEYNLDHDESKTLNLNYNDIVTNFNLANNVNILTPLQLSVLINNNCISKLINPDFILHKRGTNENNILVIEFKKATSTRNSTFDRLKLQQMKKPNPLNYKYACFIELDMGEEAHHSKVKIDFI